MPRAKAVIGGLCWLAAAVVILGRTLPHGQTPGLIHLLVSASVAGVGAWWLLGRWPPYPLALALVGWVDASAAIGAAALPDGAAQWCAFIVLGWVGVLAAFLFGARVVAAHCGMLTALTIGLAAFWMLDDHARWGELYAFVVPALLAAVVVPIVAQTIIEPGRRIARRTARDAVTDPMTGLYNRRGMYSVAADKLTARAGSILVAAVIDLDSFKDVNDTHGHDRGDTVLQVFTDALRTRTRSGDVVARVGGDEFVVLAAFDSLAGIEGFIARIHHAMQTAAPTITASVGIAWLGIDTLHGGIDPVLRHADTAMYQAKRRGGGRIHHQDTLANATAGTSHVGITRIIAVAPQPGASIIVTP